MIFISYLKMFVYFANIKRIIVTQQFTNAKIIIIITLWNFQNILILVFIILIEYLCVINAIFTSFLLLLRGFTHFADKKLMYFILLYMISLF